MRRASLFAINRTMHVLGIDTALDACSVALLKGDEVVVDKFTPLAKGHAETIALLVSGALDEAGLTVKDIARVGVVVGPGGFTGARAGLAFAQGLAIGVDLELIGIDSFRALHASHRGRIGTTPAAIALDARRGQVYLALYDGEGRTSMPGCAANIDEATGILRTRIDGDLMLVGGGAHLIACDAPGWRVLPDSEHISATSVARLAAAAREPFPPVAPIYLRAPDAKKSAARLFARLLASDR